MRSTLTMPGRREPTTCTGLRCAARVSLLLGILLTAPLVAHEGEVHDGFPASAAGQAIEPRFATAGDTVEVVGVLAGGHLWLYVSRFATNAPWPGLRIEVARGGRDVRAEPVSAGVYRVAAGALQRSGRHAVVLSLQDGELDELLTAQLVVDGEPGQKAGQPRSLLSAGGTLLAAAVAIHLVDGWRVRRRRRAREVRR